MKIGEDFDNEVEDSESLCLSLSSHVPGWTAVSPLAKVFQADPLPLVWRFVQPPRDRCKNNSYEVETDKRFSGTSNWL